MKKEYLKIKKEIVRDLLKNKADTLKALRFENIKTMFLIFVFLYLLAITKSFNIVWFLGFSFLVLNLIANKYNVVDWKNYLEKDTDTKYTDFLDVKYWEERHSEDSIYELIKKRTLFNNLSILILLGYIFIVCVI